MTNTRIVKITLAALALLLAAVFVATALFTGEKPSDATPLDAPATAPRAAGETPPPPSLHIETVTPEPASPQASAAQLAPVPAPPASPQPDSVAPGRGLHFPPEPPGGRDAALAAVARAGNPSSFEPLDPATQRVLPLLAQYTLPVNFAGLPTTGVTPQGALEIPQPASPYPSYFIESGGKIVRRVNMTIVSGGTARTAGISNGGNGLMPAFGAVLDALAALDQVRAGSFEARLLVFRGPNNTNTGLPVIWLKSDPLPDATLGNPPGSLPGLPNANPPAPDLIYDQGFQTVPAPPLTMLTAAEFLQKLRDQRTTVLSGTVVDPDGKPVPGATLFYDSNGSLAFDRPCGQTDANGNFTFNALPPGRQYSLAAKSPGQMGYIQLLNLPAGAETRVTINLAPTASISGLVLDSAGQPAAHAAIAYRQTQAVPPGGRPIDFGGIFVGGTAAGTTDANGAFTISGLAAGQFVVTAALHPADVPSSVAQLGFAPPVILTSGAETKLPDPLLLAPSGSVSGAVVDADGAPAANATVSIISGNQIIRIGPADAQGRFTFFDLPPGRYHVSAATGTGGRSAIAPPEWEVKSGSPTNLTDPIRLSRGSTAGG